MTTYKGVHFGAGNIGRGFIGEILAKNRFQIDFVDINETIINALKERQQYSIGLADVSQQSIEVKGVNGLNNQREPEAVVDAICQADLVTTAIGPQILPFIAQIIAQGIQKRFTQQNTTPLDVIACENMIGGSQFLKEHVMKFLTQEEQLYVERYIGFPNAAVDRIVPLQQHEDPLFVSVEPFSEWIVETANQKATHLQLDGVLYVEQLQPYIERKLFSVNTGHATVAYTGAMFGFQTIDEALRSQTVLMRLKAVLQETGELLVAKWGFNREEHQHYIDKIISRFENPYISDDISRVARTPIRKLGYDERFIRPIREAKDHGLTYEALLQTAASIFLYVDSADAESMTLQNKLETEELVDVVKEVTNLTDEEVVSQLVAEIKHQRAKSGGLD